MSCVFQTEMMLLDLGCVLAVEATVYNWDGERRIFVWPLHTKSPNTVPPKHVQLFHLWPTAWWSDF